MHLDTTQTLTCSRRGRGIHLPVLTEGDDDIVRLGVDASTWLIANYIMCGIGDGA